jgi:dihydrofolate synthase/folylpolyglutamate synthase
LGNTLREIATEKAGIIKKCQSVKVSKYQVVISAPQEKEAAEVIRKKCKKTGAKLYEVGKDITYKVKDKVEVKAIFYQYKDLKLRLFGKHQIINAATAIGAVEALRFYGINVGVDSIRRGIYNTLWPGRCEMVAKNPLVVLDGAQNLASAQALKKAIKDNFKYKKVILVLGVSQDKDLRGICQELRSLADTVILTRADNPRATKPEILATYFRGKSSYITQSTKEAKKLAQKLAKKEDLILATGSLFVVGEYRDVKK